MAIEPHLSHCGIHVGREAGQARARLPPNAEVAAARQFVDEIQLCQHFRQVHGRCHAGRSVEHELADIVADPLRFGIVGREKERRHRDGVRCAAQRPLVGVVDLDRYASLGMPTHDSLAFGDRFAEGPVGSQVEDVVPEQRNRSPGVVDRARQDVSHALHVARAAVAPHQGVVAPAGGLVDPAEIFFRAQGHATGPVLSVVHLVRAEKTRLRVLVGAQRQHVDDLCGGDSCRPLDRLVDGPLAKVMPQEGQGALGLDPAYQVLRPIDDFTADLPALKVGLANQIRGAAAEGGLERAGICRNRAVGIRSAEDQPQPALALLAEPGKQLVKQAGQSVGRQPVTQSQHIRAPGRYLGDDGLDRLGCAQKPGFVSGRGGKGQEPAHTRDMDAITQAGCQQPALGAGSRFRQLASLLRGPCPSLPPR